MKAFACPFCKNDFTKIYSKNNKYFVSSGVILRYRECPCCGAKFMTKDDTEKEILFRTINKSINEMLKEV